MLSLLSPLLPVIPVNSAVYFLSLPFLIVCLLFLITVLLKWLWNITVPKIFPLRDITYWEAFRLLIIAWILFGGFQWFF